MKFQRAPLKFHSKLWTYTPQRMHITDFYFCVWFRISLNCDVISFSETVLWSRMWDGPIKYTTLDMVLLVYGFGVNKQLHEIYAGSRLGGGGGGRVHVFIEYVVRLRSRETIIHDTV